MEYELQLPKRETLLQLKKIENILSSMKWPSYKIGEKTHNSRTNILKGGQSESNKGKEISAFVLGKVRQYNKCELVNSRHTIKFKDLFQELKTLIKLHNPNFKFTSIQLNNGTMTSWHYDKNNRGKSYCIGCGNYKGGGIDLRVDNKIVHIDNKNKFFHYNGNTIEHRTSPKVSGTRYAIIFYTRRQDRKIKKP